MGRIYAAFVMFFLTSAFIVGASASEKIIIKFREGFPAGLRIDSTAAPELAAYPSKRLIRPALIEALARKLAGRRESLGRGRENPLSRLYVIEVDANAQAFAKKISSLPYIEYAEPYPRHQFFNIPNDTLLPEQQHLPQIHAFEAWDVFTPLDTVVIGIVDTGVDYEHVDLGEQMYVNPGESGQDSAGRDKRGNGLDDDGNGFIDDWRGWDFVSSDSAGEDNDPIPGPSHGTHVAGIAAATINNIAGGAGIAKAVRIMPVKVATDNPFDRSVVNSYEGLLYAAVNGADVINLSWGSNSNSTSEKEVLAQAVAAGALIVGAAGNDSQETQYFPAGYEGIISVASVEDDDKKAYYSNYHSSVDVSAPGSNILSTVPGGFYQRMSGTSMASPVVAGVAALVRAARPELNASQVGELLKATSDNIDTLNTFYVGKIGAGRINAYRALADKNPRSLIIKNIKIEDETADGSFDEGERTYVSFTVANALTDLENPVVKFYVYYSAFTSTLIDSIEVGELKVGEEKEFTRTFSFTVPTNLALDYRLEYRLVGYEDSVKLGSSSALVTVNPSFRNMTANNIKTTINSRGNIAYNDYPQNAQGIGFHYGDSDNLLYEGSLIVAENDSTLSSVARGSVQSYQDRDFQPEKAVTIDSVGGKIDGHIGSAKFRDEGDFVEAGVAVDQTIYQFKTPRRSDFLLISYDIIDTRGKARENLFAGLYFDWDIGVSLLNECLYKSDIYGGFVRSLEDSLPIAGAMLISDQRLNFYPINNDGKSEQDPGVWDGYTRREKWLTISSGVARSKSETTDVSMAIGAGPIKLGPNDTARVVFAIYGANNEKSLSSIYQAACDAAIELGLTKTTTRGELDGILSPIFPSPADEMINIKYKIPEPARVTIRIVDSRGGVAARVVGNENFPKGRGEIKYSVKSLPQGAYWVELDYGSGVARKKFVIMR